MPTLSEANSANAAKAIEFEGVTKTYRLGAGRQSLREALSAVPKRLNGRHDGRDPQDGVLHAVKDVSFRVEPGATLGIVGRNGAGKTTILKLLSGVTRATVGNIRTYGRTSALIELGAGFHPDLTGRENVYLNGAILGLSRREIDAKYEAIVAFAELEPFMDTPVKRYSSGMYARLGFAVAAHVEPEIMLVDEVLSVGDLNFQRKCFDFIRRFVNGGHTTVFVSHNMFALEQLCDRVLWLDQGRVRGYGPAQAVLHEYVRAQEARLAEVEDRHDDESGVLLIERVYSTDSANTPQRTFHPGEDLVVHVAYEARQPVARPHFVIAVWDAVTSHAVFIASMLVDNQAPAELSGKGEVVCHFKSPPLMPRTYQIWGEVWSADRRAPLVAWRPLAAFSIEDCAAGPTAPGAMRHERTDAPVRVPYRWHL